MGRGEGVLMDSDLWVGVLGTETRRGGASGGVLTRPGMVQLKERKGREADLCLCLCLSVRFVKGDT